MAENILRTLMLTCSTERKWATRGIGLICVYVMDRRPRGLLSADQLHATRGEHDGMMVAPEDKDYVAA